MSFAADHDLENNDASQIAHVINHISAGIWEFDVNTSEVKWSDGFYKVLGYEPGEIECSYNSFIENLLYHGDRDIFSKSIVDRGSNNGSTVQIRLLTKNAGYQWFEHTTRRSDDFSSHKLYGSIININAYKLAELHSAQRDDLFEETGKIAKVAVWEYDIVTRNFTLSNEGYDLLELTNRSKLSLEELTNFFDPVVRQSALTALDNIVKFSRAFDIELQSKTARNRSVSLRFKAIPIIDDFGRCISLKGIIQDIDYIKKRESALQSSLNLTADQNKRLQNFAYIVSHNLRSHTGNLEFMVNLFKDSETQAEKDEVFEHIRSISQRLSTTVAHLDEVVKIQTEIYKDRKVVEFEPLFKDIVRALATNINDANAKVEFDFTRCPEINYIPAYMESILQNLLTNAIKYRASDRQPLIKCYTYTEGKHIYLIFQDNGKGIDLEKHGGAVFGMYKTFHQNADAKGIGLFITRNQVESLGGTIKIESTVDVGTKFTIMLA